ncbi:MAG TPA: AraC family transcriptional regulator [Candidatus Krumholzibacteria bacterium]|nr:AraC family transcriptional regulator [Candidatus Krumholzibacteria bacterium]
MSGDTLSDLLRAVRLRGAVFFYIKGASPWVAETPPAEEFIRAIMPGVDQLMPFHGLAKGSCWAAIAGEKPVLLEEGDVVLFPHGDPHVMSSTPGLRAQRVSTALYFAPRPPQLPQALSVNNRGETTALLDGGGRDQTTVVCGYLGCDARPFNPLLSSLPRLLAMRGIAGDGASWLGSFLRSAVEESNVKRPGGEAMLERMSEMMFVDVLRRYVDTLPPGQTGWLAGVRDETVGRALALMHARPGENWTLERLGEEVGLSRSSFHERFVHFIGQPPMQYLTKWRIQIAATALRDTDAKVIEVALSVGYESEAAFARAFKRVVGESPGAWRRARRARSTPSEKQSRA